MPCETVTIPAPQPNIVVTFIAASGGDNTASVEWEASNFGDATGDESFNVSAGNKTKTETVTLAPSQVKNSVTNFSFNFSNEQQISACVEDSCQTITVTVSKPDINIDNMNVSASERSATVTYEVSNSGDATGSRDIDVTFDLEADGSVEDTRTFTHSLQPGEVESNTVDAQFQIDEDKQLRVCVE